MARSPLSSVDTAWLRMEHPTNLMMITGVMVFRAPMDFERLKTTLEHRLLRFDRFRQRVVRPRLPIGWPYWQDDPQFDLNQHVHRVSLGASGDLAALEELVNELMSTPLDFSRPLWELHLVEGYADGRAIGDGCALIVRLHHCTADGIALVRVLLSLTDTDPAAPWPSATLREPPADRHGSLEAMNGEFATPTRYLDCISMSRTPSGSPSSAGASTFCTTKMAAATIRRMTIHAGIA